VQEFYSAKRRRPRALGVGAGGGSNGTTEARTVVAVLFGFVV
jgi:hypothetical protein